MVRLLLLGALAALAVSAVPGYGGYNFRPGSVTPYQRKRPLPNAFVSSESEQYDPPADDGYAPAEEPAPVDVPSAREGEYEPEEAGSNEGARQSAAAEATEQGDSEVEGQEAGGSDGGEERFRETRGEPMSALQTDQFASNQDATQQQLQRQLRAQQLQLQQQLQHLQQLKNAPQAPPSEDNGPSMPTEPPSKLDTALVYVKDDLMKKSRQVEQEVQWIQQVKAITSSYAEKMARVEENVNALRNEVMDLYSKKKQIQNLQMQKKLRDRLEDATKDLDTVTKALSHVQTKEEEFQRTRDNIQATIYNIRHTLDQLAGQGGKVEGVDDDSDEKVENDIASEVKDEAPASDDLGGWTEELKAAKVESK